jgi:hypothetical protein
MPVAEIARVPMGASVDPGTEMATDAGTFSGDVPRPAVIPAHRASHGWQPLAGASLLERLRVTGRPRLKADPELRRELRKGLERGIRCQTPGGPAGGTDVDASSLSAPVLVTKDRLTGVLACEAHHVAGEFGERPPTLAMACGALMDVLFRQLITVGGIDDPLVDGLAALQVDDRQRDLASWIERLPGADRIELRTELERQVEGLHRRWPRLEPAWLPRTQEAMRVGLAGGAVRLSARVDLAIGTPPEDEASVALVEIKAGARRLEHRADLHFYALVEALRSIAPPFVVATYYTRTGELDVDPVTEELLVAAARRTAAGTSALWNLARGAEPRRTPSYLCGRCVQLPECEPGRTRLAGPGAGRARRPTGGATA